MGIVKEGKEHFLVVKTKLRSNEKNEIEWMVKFKDGGWNSVWAKPEPMDEPINVANEKFPDLIVSSVVPMTDEKEKEAMMNFY